MRGKGEEDRKGEEGEKGKRERGINSVTIRHEPFAICCSTWQLETGNCFWGKGRDGERRIGPNAER